MPRRKPEEPRTVEHACAVSGCGLPGEYRAPKSRDNLQEYQWLCLEHIRAFNQSWDYFKGMQTEEIEAFRQDALTGHRPTWQREDHIKRKKGDYGAALEEGLARFFHWDEASIRRASVQSLPTRERKALATLELDDRVSAAELKRHFRTLVKRHHPDLHPGDREVEEKFKQINAAYRYLQELYEVR